MISSYRLVITEMENFRGRIMPRLSLLPKKRRVKSASDQTVSSISFVTDDLKTTPMDLNGNKQKKL